MIGLGGRPRRVGLIRAFCHGLLPALAFCTAALASPEDWAELLRLDRGHGRAWAVVSSFEPQLNETTAYAIQRAMVAGEPVLAYRAAFLSPLIQQQLRIREPALGVLTRPQQLIRHPHVVYLQPHQRLSLEAGLAFRLKTDLPAPVASVAELRGRLDALVPVLIVADQVFSTEATPTRLDYVAINLGSLAIATGAAMALTDQPLTDLKLAIARDGRQVLWGRSRELGASPLEAVRWLVNHAQRAGYRLKAGQLLFAGAWGRQLPALPGRYVAAFEGLGEVTIEFRSGGRLSSPKRPAGAKPTRRPPPRPRT